MVNEFGCGKGDDPRNIDKKAYDANFTKIFGEYVPPRIKRLNELEVDLKDCKKALKTMAPNDPDREKIERLIPIIEQEIEDL